MSTTTLMTFLLRTSPSTRSVKLLGSWDNFSIPYSMEKDTKTGLGHWRGCHTFKNIICDGEVGGPMTIRNGGLKMGGTYWYYYQLDNEIEFHNSAEPSTMACPMLPGQTVNVLHVPTQIGSGNRSREGSVSSTSSEYRTMNPEDKYLNPRPVPKPSLPKLTTSLSSSFLRDRSLSSPSPVGPSSAGADYRGPFSASSTRKIRLPRKDFLGRNRSVSPKRSGFRAALSQIAAPRSAGPELEDARGRRGAWNAIEMDISSPTLLTRSDTGQNCLPISPPFSAPASNINSREVSPHPPQFEQIPCPPSRLPRHVRDQERKINPLGCHRVRSARSRSRDPSPLRRSMSLEDDDIRPLKESVLSCLKPLETLEEQNTPGFMPEHVRNLSEANTTTLTLEELNEKRLPTLPNSPSSVIEEMTMDTPVPEKDDTESQSHFSAFTMNSTIDEQPRSHFSEFTVRSIGSPSSTYSSTFDYKSPSLSGHTDHSSFPTSPYHLPCMPETPAMNDGLESYSLTTPKTVEAKSSPREQNPSTHDDPMDLEDNMKGLCIDSPHPPSSSSAFRPPGLSVGFQGYKLPADATSSVLTLRKANSLTHDTPQTDGDVQMSDDGWRDVAQPNPHTTTMQRLMDELSYLGEMIQS